MARSAIRGYEEELLTIGAWRALVHGSFRGAATPKRRPQKLPPFGCESEGKYIVPSRTSSCLDPGGRPGCDGRSVNIFCGVRSRTVRAGVPQHLVMASCGWENPEMFRRYPISDAEQTGVAQDQLEAARQKMLNESRRAAFVPSSLHLAHKPEELTLERPFRERAY
jgi:hypothetical protein